MTKVNLALGEDQRRYPRVKIVLPVEVKNEACEIADISEGGIFVPGFTSARQGEEVTVRFPFMNAELTAVVRWVSAARGAGLEFIELNEMVRLQLRTIVQIAGGQS